MCREVLVNVTHNGFSAGGHTLLLDAPNMLSILGVTSEVVFLLPSAVYIDSACYQAQGMG